MQLYQQLLTQAQGVAATPYNPYGGELVAGVNPQQSQGIAGTNTYANAAQPYLQTAEGMAQSAAAPISAAQIQQYESPYTQQVVNATQAQFNNQNAQQMQGVKGNAIAQGALGGNREAIAEAETANQQQLAQAPVIANLQNQGYQTGLNTALAEQQAQAAGAYSVGNLGVAGQTAGLTGAAAQIGAGSLQQQTQQAQDTAAYQQFLNQQAYPFQTTQWLAGLGTGVGSQMGGTSSTTSPGPNPIAQYGGLALAGLGMFLKRGGGVANRDGGGGVNYQTFGGGFGTPQMPYSGGKGYIPTMGITHGSGAPRPPNAPGQQQTNPLQQANQIMGLANKLQGKLGSSNSPTDINSGGYDTAGGGLSLGDAGGTGLGDMGGLYRRGGVVRGFADGGDPSFDDRFSGTDPGMLPPTIDGVPTQLVLGQGGFDGASAPNFNDRFTGDVAPPAGIMPSKLDGMSTATLPPSQGFGDASVSVDNPTATPISLTSDDQDAPSAQGVVPNVPIPHERPLTGIDAAPDRSITQDTPTAGYADNMDRIAAAHRQIESGGNYNSLGPVNPKTGDRAYGAYQVMGANIPNWTQEILGHSMTPSQFLGSKEAQDAVYKAKMGQYINQSGLDGAVHKWLGPGARDFSGTTQADYLNKFKAALGMPSDASSTKTASNIDLPSAAAPTQYKQSEGVAPAYEGGPLGKLLHGLGVDINLSPQAKMAMMNAGFGMMSSTSPFAGVAIGQGAQQGLQTYTAGKLQEQNAAYNKAKLDLDARKLSQEADKSQRELTQRAQIAQMPYQGMTQDQQAQQSLKRQELNMKLMEPKPYFNSDTGQMDYTVRTPEGDVVSLGTGKIIVGPHRGQVIPSPNAPGSPPTNQPGQTAPPQQSGFQETAFHPDGVWKVNSQQAAAPADYSNGSKVPYIEHGMAVPDPTPVAGYSPDTIKTAAEWYLKTGKQPIISRGASPVAQMQNSYARAVMNYGNSLAASRGVSREELTDIWQTAPKVGQFILGQPGQQIVSLGTAMRHLETLKEYEDAWQKAKLGDNRPLNAVQAYIKTQWGSDAATNLSAVAHVLGPEIIKAIGVAGAGTDKDRADASGMFTASGSEQQVNGAIQATEKLLRGQLIGKENQARAAGLSEGRLQKMIGDKEYQALANLDHASSGAPGAPAAATPTKLAVPPGMMDWIAANPNDPKVPLLKQKYGVQ